MAVMSDHALILEVADFEDLTRWRWRLLDARGAFLADHSVSLDSADVEYLGFIDPIRFLGRYADPKSWPDDEERLLAQLGAWMGDRVLGPVGAAILRHGTPVPVRVIVPPQGAGLLDRPLE